MPIKSTKKAIIVGISGASSSGKTTLSRILRDVFPDSFILHQDDFYRPEKEIPITHDGLQNWDCAEALDIQSLLSSLEHIHLHGTPPPDLISKEDQNHQDTGGISTTTISDLRQQVLRQHPDRPARIVFLDGFLLYGVPVPQIRAALDLRLFILAPSFAEARRRRQARAGYVTLEGFWVDPPGYMERVVWPAYVREHAYMFVDRDVDLGQFDQDVLRREGIKVLGRGRKEQETDMMALAKEAVAVLLEELGKESSLLC